MHRKKATLLIWIFIACSIFGLLKVSLFHFTYNTDYETYIQTSKLLAGENVAEVFGFRLLKPLAPLAITALSPILGYEYSFYFFVIIFFGLIGSALYLLYKRLLEEDSTHTSAEVWIPWLLFMTSYPLLRYGLDAYTETGAWFFYIAGLVSTYVFLKDPSTKNAALNAAIFSLGFLWKEYAAINVVVFALVLVFGTGNWKEKIRNALVSGGIFILIQGVYQLYIWKIFDYTYADWLVIGATGYGDQFTFFNISKSLFALLLGAWFFVLPGGYWAWKKLHSLRLFILFGVASSGLFLAWGYVSSRLYFVAAPLLFFLAGYGLIEVVKNITVRYAILGACVALQIFYLFYLTDSWK